MSRFAPIRISARTVTSSRCAEVIFCSSTCTQSGTTKRGEMTFAIRYPCAAANRLFLQYSVGGEVRTVAFTSVVD